VVNRMAPPAAAGVILGRPKPSISTNGSGSVCLINTEQISGVATTTAFTAAVLRLVPSTLPWLSGIAANFSKWRWLSLRVIYIPQASTGTSGSFHMGFQYDDTDTNPTSSANMSMLYAYTTGPAWAGWEGAELMQKPYLSPPPGSIVSVLDVTRFDKPWYAYITSTNLSALSPPLTPTVSGNLYCPAELVYAFEAGPVSPVGAGQLYIQYEVEMIEPIAVVNNA